MYITVYVNISQARYLEINSLIFFFDMISYTIIIYIMNNTSNMVLVWFHVIT